MNDIVAQARAQWSAIATESATELAEAETRLAKAHAEAERNAEELKKSTAKLAAVLGREHRNATDAYPVETFSFGPDPDATDTEDAVERVPQQAPVPSPPGRRRPAAEHADDEDGPRILNDSW
jgi:outer membrane protein TolC